MDASANWNLDTTFRTVGISDIQQKTDTSTMFRVSLADLFHTKPDP